MRFLRGILAAAIVIGWVWAVLTGAIPIPDGPGGIVLGIGLGCLVAVILRLLIGSPRK